MSSTSLSESEVVVDAATVATIQGDGSAFRVASVALDYLNADTTRLPPIVVGTFTIPGRGGVFTSHVRWSREWDVELGATMGYFASQIQRVYGV